jgi:hypothetical protein
MNLQEILDRIYSIQNQIREDNVAGALDDLNVLEDDLEIAIEKQKHGPMTAAEEDRNAGITRLADGSVQSEATDRYDHEAHVKKHLEAIDKVRFADARDHHLIRQNYRRMVGLDK